MNKEESEWAYIPHPAILVGLYLRPSEQEKDVAGVMAGNINQVPKSNYEVTRLTS